MSPQRPRQWLTGTPAIGALSTDLTTLTAALSTLGNSFTGQESGAQGQLEPADTAQTAAEARQLAAPLPAPPAPPTEFDVWADPECGEWTWNLGLLSRATPPVLLSSDAPLLFRLGPVSR